MPQLLLHASPPAGGTTRRRSPPTASRHGNARPGLMDSKATLETRLGAACLARTESVLARRDIPRIEGNGTVTIDETETDRRGIIITVQCRGTVWPASKRKEFLGLSFFFFSDFFLLRLFQHSLASDLLLLWLGMVLPPCDGWIGAFWGIYTQLGLTSELDAFNGNGNGTGM